MQPQQRPQKPLPWFRRYERPDHHARRAIRLSRHRLRIVPCPSGCLTQFVLVFCQRSRSSFSTCDRCSFSGFPFQGSSVCLNVPLSVCLRGSFLGVSWLMGSPSRINQANIARFLGRRIAKKGPRLARPQSTAGRGGAYFFMSSFFIPSFDIPFLDVLLLVPVVSLPMEPFFIPALSVLFMPGLSILSDCGAGPVEFWAKAVLQSRHRAEAISNLFIGYSFNL